MHKPAQIELQLDRPQLPYSEILGPIIARGSPAHYRGRQPNPTKKGPYKHKDMITQETKPVKTWGEFNLTILNVNLNPLSWKNRSLYNKTYKPPLSTSYCYPSVELTDTTTYKLRIHRLLLSWILHQIQAHPFVFYLNFNGSNWNNHQGVEKSSPSKP